MTIAGHTDTGRVRARNEDCMGWDEDAAVAVVADGLGGHPAGDRASRLAVDTALAAVSQERKGGRWLATGAEPGPVFEAMHRALLEHGRRHPEHQGLGTTAVLAAWDPPRLVIAHCGDSRAYRLRRGRLECLTADHNAAREAVERGELTREEARHSPERHQLTRALGIGREVPFADIRELMLEPGERILLCSDGLTGELSDEAIEALLGQRANNPDQAVRGLVGAALAHGGRDNVTAVVVAPD